jgi:hypothetical protein
MTALHLIINELTKNRQLNSLRERRMYRAVDKESTRLKNLQPKKTRNPRKRHIYQPETLRN